MSLELPDACYRLLECLEEAWLSRRLPVLSFAECSRTVSQVSDSLILCEKHNLIERRYVGNYADLVSGLAGMIFEVTVEPYTTCLQLTRSGQECLAERRLRVSGNGKNCLAEKLRGASGNGKEKPKATVAARMLDLVKDLATHTWTAEQFRQKLGCNSRSTITATPAWKQLAVARESARLRQAEQAYKKGLEVKVDKRRRPKRKKRPHTLDD